jgi:hypothetical protein
MMVLIINQFWISTKQSMPKSIKWSSFADKDLAKLLEYLDSKWG